MSATPSSFPDLASTLKAIPHQPGVYLFRDRLNRIIYVGKARDLCKRVSQYFHASRKKIASDWKTRALVESIWHIETHTVRSEPEAILLEGRLIKEYRPKYNISFRDDKRFLLVKVNLNEPYPRFTLTRLKKEDGARYFGPFAHSGALRSTLNLMRKKFGLRSCKPTVPTEKDYKHCLDHIIKNCSAPCVAKISQEQYRNKVHEACDFLEGQSRQLQFELNSEMQKAAAGLDFERAAMLRDMIADLKKTTRPSRRFQREIPTTIIPERDLEELKQCLTLRKIPRHIECFDISNISTTHKVASMVVFKNGRPDRYQYRRYRIKTVVGQNDFASMEEVIYRRYRRVLGFSENTTPILTEIQLKRLPDLIVVDGGKGQLSAALKAFQQLKVLPPAILGLAKENEEIYLPEKLEPLILSHETGALKLLQRIRDEAHRVANEYHQLLLKRRISESLLDDCPGVSDARKRALLKTFGSVDRLKKTSVEAIAKIPGISKKLAQEILTYLKS
ncbi:MAG: excinuclease ABC subunit UvrC [Verrucomicrobiae bacterium]|nr:excinuclease ABC subunit UvrC [Verrucomicrobiae bacterium]